MYRPIEKKQTNCTAAILPNAGQSDISLFCSKHRTTNSDTMTA